VRFAAIPARNLRRRPARTLLTLCGIAVAVGSLVAMVGLANGFGQAWMASLNERNTHLIGVQKGVVEILTSTVSETAIAEAREVPGVALAYGTLIGLVPAAEDYTVFVSGWAPDDPGWRDMTYRQGGPPRPEDGNVTVLGEAVADALGLSIGDEIALLYRPFRVVGIARFGNAINNNMAQTLLAPMQALLHREQSLSLLHIRLDRPNDAPAVAETTRRLQEALPEVSFSGTGELAEENEIVALLDAIAWASSAVAIFMGGVIVTNTLLMAVAERTAEIGLLSAVGWSRRRILSMVLIEGLILGGIGGMLGALLGVAAAYWVASLPVVGGFLEPQVTVPLVLQILAAVLLLGAVGGLYPAWRAVRIQPAAALRHG
jgi:putative ABC transport system permease protein